jgi:hypothetical protein
MPKQKGDKHRFMDKCRAKARELIAERGANAIDDVKPCTPMENAMIQELRINKLSRIERAK